MSTFSVTCHRIAVEPHPNADRLELAGIGGYRAIVLKDQFKTGDLVAYIPEASLVPAELIEQMGLTGRLAGPAHNRVKAIRLRGVTSQGLCLAAKPEWVEGQDVTGELGVVKYEPPVPSGMKGHGIGRTDLALRYDIENIKAMPDVLQEGEKVIVTEKIHGTFCAFIWDGETWLAGSKGLLAKGVVFDNVPENDGNIYIQALRKVLDTLSSLQLWLGNSTTKEPLTVWVLGELFGPGVQDLQYGQLQRKFRLFDMAYRPLASRNNADLHWAESATLTALEMFSIERVPVLYEGPYNCDMLKVLTDGWETVSGKTANVREGVVVRAVPDRFIARGLPCEGRVQLKSVSDDYLFRSGEQPEFA